MDVIDKGRYQIEAGLSKEDVDELFLGRKLVGRGILTGEQILSIHSFEYEKDRDKMVPENERMPAKIKYHPVYYPLKTRKLVIEERKKRDLVYAKWIENGDVDVFMSQATAQRIHPDGITEINAKMPQILTYHPDNHVKIFVKIPF